MYILQLSSTKVTLANAGGKGMNLARLASAGLPVPGGFVITTDAYQTFVNANGLQNVIQVQLSNSAVNDAQSLDNASTNIRKAFSESSPPPNIRSAILEAYASLQSTSSQLIPVAVRSSATTEDLPNLSFAGQQDTYLNVIGQEQLLKAIVNCWSSLWTGRAIGYRMRNEIQQEEALLAVVVQAMVQSEAAGVLFTANPLTGLRGETVIDATLGLGEALVSGQVDPDHYVADGASGKIKSRQLGDKKIAIRSKPGGGVEKVSEVTENQQALDDDDIRRLTALGAKIQAGYGFPQDVEWALADHNLYILQSRPITSLFPIPYEQTDPLDIWFSFGAVQGVLGAITPLGQDAIRMIFCGGGRLFGVKLRYDTLTILTPAGERMWVKISDLLRHPIGVRAANVFLGMIEPSVRQIMIDLEGDPQLGAGKGKVKLSTLRALSRFFLPFLGRLIATLRHPEKARSDFNDLLDSELVRPVIAGEDPFIRLARRLDFMRDRTEAAFYNLLPRFVPLLGGGMAMLNLLNKASGAEVQENSEFSTLVMEATRGLPDNVTTEMDLALWSAATAIQNEPAARAFFQERGAAELADCYLAGSLPDVAQLAVGDFMTQYGMRGIGEIDLGRARWREEPVTILRTLQSYLQIPPEQAPDVLFERGAQAAQSAVDKLAVQARRKPSGWLREKLVRFSARRVRILLGVREAPKFYAVRMMGYVRAELLASGRDFTELGYIEKPEDLFFLHFGELETLSRKEPGDWKALISRARQAYENENRRKQVPQVLVSDGRTFYEGMPEAEVSKDVISGSPVSPGMVEGNVHVILDPRGAHLAPGEILVCPGTDPAWTPLFMVAGGLITEVGGMMTHGSVVAREYGIPAVVGVNKATERLKTGQHIRVDGSTGKIMIIEQRASDSE
jgi:phosphohistidine swiveling domain-containing protein